MSRNGNGRRQIFLVLYTRVLVIFHASVTPPMSLTVPVFMASERTRKTSIFLKLTVRLLKCPIRFYRLPPHWSWRTNYFPSVFRVLLRNGRPVVWHHKRFFSKSLILIFTQIIGYHFWGFFLFVVRTVFLFVFSRNDRTEPVADRFQKSISSDFLIAIIRSISSLE